MTRRRSASRPEGDGRHLSHDVRIWNLGANEGSQNKTYTVRWVVAGTGQQATFRTRALADGYGSKLVSFAQRGVPFDRTTGLPEPMLRALESTTWLTHACQFAEMKWPHLAPMSASR